MARVTYTYLYILYKLNICIPNKRLDMNFLIVVLCISFFWMTCWVSFFPQFIWFGFLNDESYFSLSLRGVNLQWLQAATSWCQSSLGIPRSTATKCVWCPFNFSLKVTQLTSETVLTNFTIFHHGIISCPFIIKARQRTVARCVNVQETAHRNRRMA